MWVGLDGDEIICGHLSSSQQKLKNVARDPRVALSIEAPGRNAIGEREEGKAERPEDETELDRRGQEAYRVSIQIPFSLDIGENCVRGKPE